MVPPKLEIGVLSIFMQIYQVNGKKYFAIDPNKKDLIGYAIVPKKKQSTHIHLLMINENTRDIRLVQKY